MFSSNLCSSSFFLRLNMLKIRPECVAQMSISSRHLQFFYMLFNSKINQLYSVSKTYSVSVKYIKCVVCRLTFPVLCQTALPVSVLLILNRADSCAMSSLPTNHPHCSHRISVNNKQ